MEQHIPLNVDQAIKDRLHPESYDVYEKIMARLPSIQTDPFYLIIHGQAGTGKTELLKTLRDGVNVRFGDENACIVTAPTAQGANLVGARTINSTFLLPWNIITLRVFLEEADLNQLLSMNWMSKSKILLVDVINFVGSICFYSINHRLQQIFNNTKPFGGLSVLVFGDFLQLPPIEDNWIFEGLPFDYLEKQRELVPGCMENLWSLFKFVELVINKKIKSERQQYLFNCMRLKDNEYELWKYLDQHCVDDLDITQNEDTIVKLLEELSTTHPNKTFAVLGYTREVINRINVKAVKQHCFKHFKPIESRGSGRKGHVSDQNLLVAIGSPVVITINDESGITNGSFGTVESFDQNTINVKFLSETVPIFRETWIDERYDETWEQFPLRLAYALQVHQAQGVSFDGVILIRNRNWEENKDWKNDDHDGTGSMYCALSRARDLNICRIFPFRWLKWKPSRRAHQEVVRLSTNCKIF